MRLCTIEGCTRRRQARGMCTMHYKRWKKHGDPLVVRPAVKPTLHERCTTEDCDRPHLARGLCSLHYSRWLRHGDPLRGALTPEERFWARVERSADDECWLWTGALNDQGYGRFHDGERDTSPHRFAHRLLIGPIPEGLEVDHVAERGCIHRHCVNPRHLEAVTHAENNRRSTSPSALHGTKTHCVNGHEFTPENTYMRDGTRNCRACGADRKRAERAA